MHYEIENLKILARHSDQLVAGDTLALHLNGGNAVQLAVEVEDGNLLFAPAYRILSACGLSLDTATNEVTVHAKARAISVSPREAALLRCFMRKPGVALSRPVLMKAVWGRVIRSTNVVDVYVNYLRNKLGEYFHTARGVGYWFGREAEREVRNGTTSNVR